MIKMHGTILELGTLDIGNLTFSKNCEITYPEKVPIKDGFEGYKTEVHDIGTGAISKDGDRFVIDAEIYDEYVDVIDKYENICDGHVSVGGHYVQIESDKEHGVRIVNKAHLKYIACTIQSANEELYLTRVGQKESKFKKYRKKPVVVEAIRLNSYAAEDIMNVLKFMGQTVNSDYITQEKFSEYCIMCNQGGGLPINTLEGNIKASIGDYIIRGVNGEYYPCKPDIFKKTYESVEEE